MIELQKIVNKFTKLITVYSEKIETADTREKVKALMERVCDSWDIDKENGFIKYLGGGSYGVAYELSNGLVLKITTDMDEIQMTALIEKANIKYSAKYYKIAKSDSLGIGFILMEKYKKWNDKYTNIISPYNFKTFDEDKVIGMALKYSKDPDNLIEEYNSKKKELVDLINSLYKEESKYVNVEKFVAFLLCNNTDYGNIKSKNMKYTLQILGFFEQIWSIGLNWNDYGVHNRMIDDNGDFVAYDFGVTSTGRPQSDMIINLECIYREIK